MYRTHNCGELNINNQNEKVTLSGWVQKARDLGGMTFIDLRDRYGITQLVFDMDRDKELCEKARKLGREFVIQIEGEVIERSNKNKNISTGEIEILANQLKVLSKSEVPPFTIEDESDGGEEIRMQYRYLDIRRNPVRKALELRHRFTKEVRNYLDEQAFVEVETPVLIKSTPEGARDFMVPSRLNQGQFYALPQSPQVFKQLLMVSGLDKYFQIVKCFRDEDFRADRQPEFTQIDCEMSFVEQKDIINVFEGLAKHLFKKIKNIDLEGSFPLMPYEEAIDSYGTDKPDIRFEMKINNMESVAKGKGFKVFDEAEYIGGICVEGCANYSRKQTDQLIDFVKKPQIGAKGLVFAKYNEDGSFKSSVDKFYSQDDLKEWAELFGAKSGDLILVISGEKSNSLNALNELRLEMGERLGLRKPDEFAPLWVVDFPLLEWDEESKRYHAMHHPFTSPKAEDLELIDSEPGKVRANAYDFVINGVEVGGGSIRIYDQELQQKMFKLLGFSDEEAKAQFGFLMNAFKYGAPPHGGIAFGLDRWVAMFSGTDSIRDVIAFPKNNSGRDVMIDAPSPVEESILTDIGLKINKKE